MSLLPSIRVVGGFFLRCYTTGKGPTRAKLKMRHRKETTPSCHSRNTLGPMASMSANGGRISKIKQFKLLPIDPEIRKFIEANQLGKRRRYFKVQPAVKSNTDDIFDKRLFSFVKSAGSPAQFPISDLPEICFIGRSNVGKSSLINSLCNTFIVRTNDKPGLTKCLNFFVLESCLGLVDLPGYGFAYASSEAIGNWIETVKIFLKNRKNLKRCFVLLDARQPIKKSDLNVLDYLDRNMVPYQLILTKADLVSPEDLARRWYQTNESLRQHKNIIKPVHMVSSLKKLGLSQVRKDIASIISPESQLKAHQLIQKKNDLVAKKLRKIEAEKRFEIERMKKELDKNSRRIQLRTWRGNKKKKQ